jgi:hypothetical protein
MANKTLIPQTDTVNSENAPAYALAPKQALAQYAATGCFGRTFYATTDEQLTRVLEVCEALDSEFIARVAPPEWDAPRWSRAALPRPSGRVVAKARNVRDTEPAARRR